MTQSNINELLAEIVRRQAARGPLPSFGQSSALAQAVLSPNVGPLSSSLVAKEDIRGPSVVNRILDLLSRPLYASAGIMEGVAEKASEEAAQGKSFGEILPGALTQGFTPSGENLQRAIAGITGREKTTGADVLETAGMGPGVGRAVAGFGFDVALDPLTYVGVGLVPKLGSAAIKSGRALTGVEEAAGRASQDLASEISRRAAQSAEQSRAPLVPMPGASAPSPGAPPRIFAAGTYEQPDLTRSAITSTAQPPPGFVALDANAISFIKQGVSRGLPIEQASLRPLLPSERSILEQGIPAGKSSRALEKELTEATGFLPEKTFTPTVAPKVLSEEQQVLVRQLEEQREQVAARIEDLEMQTSGTASPEALNAEIRRLENRLQTLTPTIQSLSRAAREKGLSAQDKARVSSEFERLNNEREQILQRLSALTEENLEATTIGPAGVTRTITNQEINDLERQLRGLGQQIEQIKRTPTVAAAGASDTIATPVPRPQSVDDLISEVSGLGINWRRFAQRQVKAIPENADKLDIIRQLELQKLITNSPVFKNMIDVQIRKLRAGVTPANLIEAARTRIPESPKINLSATRKDRATQIAKGFAKANQYEEINHIGQTNLFNRITNWINNPKNKIPEKARPSIAYQMLRVAEDELLRGGKKLIDAEGYSVRLSDVASLAGGARALTSRFVDDFRSARPMQVVEDLKAGNEPAISQQILNPVVETAAQISDSVSYLPPSRTVQLGTDVTRELEKIAKQAGASSKEASASKRFMEDFFSPSRDQLYDDVMQEARNLVRQSVTGKVDPYLTNRISKAVYDSLEANPKVLGGKIGQTKVVEAIMSRVATWWNAKDLRPFAREYIDTARNVAAAFERAMTPIVQSTTPRLRTQAWRVAQGKVLAGSPEEQQLADRFQYLVERLLGAHDVRAPRAVAESVLIRSGTTMDDINKELPKRLQFKSTKSKTDTGREYDYRDDKWMHSWKEWEGKEPAEEIYQLTRSLQVATRKNAMLDDAAARWGVPVKGGDFTHQVNVDRLQGFYFPKQIAEQLNTVWNRLESDKFYHGGTALQIFDKVQRMWKTGVTIYSPSHHIRNLNGDVFLAALDGVVTTSPYRKSLQVLHAYKGHYKDIENVFNIMDPNLRDLAIKTRPGKPIVTTRSGHTMTIEQLHEAAESQGFLLRAATLEDLIGGESAFGTFGQQFSPLGGRLHRGAAKVSETRDHFVRIAHFIDALSKSRAKSLREAIEESGKRVKKFHPDGSDLTGFEQSVMRRILPFYSWLRKATPLVLEGLAMRPHISLAFPKAMSNLQEITGIESEGPGNPFPMDQMFPDWIKEKGIGPTIPPPPFGLAGIGRQQTWRGDAPGYVVVNPTNPLIDQIKELGHPRQSLISNLTPAARILIELLTGRTALGIPLQEVEGGTTGHLLQQVPPVGIGARITGLTRPDEPYHPEQLTNWLLTGGFITGTGPYRGQAQFEIREAIQEIARRNREALK